MTRAMVYQSAGLVFDLAVLAIRVAQEVANVWADFTCVRVHRDHVKTIINLSTLTMENIAKRVSGGTQTHKSAA